MTDASDLIFLTKREAAKILGVSEDTIDRAIYDGLPNAGKLPASKLGDLVRIRKDILYQWAALASAVAEEAPNRRRRGRPRKLERRMKDASLTTNPTRQTPRV